MPTLDFPPITNEGQSWTDNAGAEWTVWEGAWIRVGGIASVISVPVGSLIAYATNVPPGGYLYCNGQEVNRTTYQALFNVIGATFGGGNGSTTFNVPDLRGRVLAGVNDGSGRLPGIDAMGETTGQHNHVLTAAEMPTHTHSGSSNSTGSHGHSAASSTTGNHNHTATTGTGGGSHLHGITIRSLAQAGGGGNSWTHSSGQTNTWNQTASHNHSMTSSSTGNHSHTITVYSAGSHSHTITIGNSGSSNGHNNTQPTMTIYWLIKT